MPNLLCSLPSRAFKRRQILQIVVFVAVVTAVLLMPTAILFAQQAPTQNPQHLNPLIEKLAQGKQVFGVSTSDMSLDNARALARSPIDYIHVDMEHAPLGFETLRTFLMGMNDKEMILKKGNAQPNVAVTARFPLEGEEDSEWIVKQGLDIGLMGINFPGIENKEQALKSIQSMRYPQKKGTPYSEPDGVRGWTPINALWVWGIAAPEYFKRADVWPLNPNGDLLASMMIESVDGVKNVDEIASVPGVGALFVGVGGDLHLSMGVEQNSPELEAAFQKILKACLAHNVACWMTVNAADMPKRVKEGWKILGVGTAGSGGGLTAGQFAALQSGRGAVGK